MGKTIYRLLQNTVKLILPFAVLAALTIGCNSEPPKKSGEDLEKAREEHKNRASRELQDG